MLQEYEAYLAREPGNLTAEQLEEAMQKVMDEYAGGIHTDYRYNRSRLTLADEKIEHLNSLPQLGSRHLIRTAQDL